MTNTRPRYYLALCVFYVFLFGLCALGTQAQRQFEDLSGDAWQKQTRTEKLNRMINMQYDNLDTASFPRPPNDSELLSYEFIVDPVFETATGLSSQSFRFTLVCFSGCNVTFNIYFAAPVFLLKSLISRHVTELYLWQRRLFYIHFCDYFVISISL